MWNKNILIIQKAYKCIKSKWISVQRQINSIYYIELQVPWPIGPKPRSAAARLLRLRVLNPPGTWMFVRCECCVLSGGGLCDELITRPEVSYRLWSVVCGLDTSSMRRQWPALGRSAIEKKTTCCGLRRPLSGSKLAFKVQLWTWG